MEKTHIIDEAIKEGRYGDAIKSVHSELLRQHKLYKATIKDLSEQLDWLRDEYKKLSLK